MLDIGDTARRLSGVLLMIPFGLGSLVPGGQRDFNAGVAAYESGKMEEARDYFQDVAQRCEPEANLCADAWYNLGNTHYRLGEAEVGYKEKRGYWEDALQAYEQSLQFSSDQQAADNRDFVQLQLEVLEAQAAAQKTEGGDQESTGSNTEAQSTTQGEANDDEGGDEGVENTSSMNDDEMGSGDETTSQSELGEGGEDGSKPIDSSDELLDARINDELEAYMRSMAEYEQRAGNGFRRNPNQSEGQDQSLFDSMLLDPFLRDFFGQHSLFGQQFGGMPDSLERDW